jgi:hypothetical protein
VQEKLKKLSPMPEKPPHYDYTRLDSFLKDDYDPQEIGDRLDMIMSRLVILVKFDEGYHERIAGEHYLLSELRDIFWTLQPTKP